MEYDIYDLSNSVKGNYWQLGYVTPSLPDRGNWEALVSAVKQGLPDQSDLRTLFFCTQPETEYKLWGCVRQFGFFWVYRIFLTGYDGSGRPGRYFFVLFKLKSLAELSAPALTRIVRHLETQTAIPVETQALPVPGTNQNEPPSVTSQLLGDPATSSIGSESLERHFKKVPEGKHYAWKFTADQLIQENTNLPALFIATLFNHNCRSSKQESKPVDNSKTGRKENGDSIVNKPDRCVVGPVVEKGNLISLNMLAVVSVICFFAVGVIGLIYCQKDSNRGQPERVVGEVVIGCDLNSWQNLRNFKTVEVAEAMASPNKIQVELGKPVLLNITTGSPPYRVFQDKDGFVILSARDERTFMLIPQLNKQVMDRGEQRQALLIVDNDKREIEVSISFVKLRGFDSPKTDCLTKGKKIESNSGFILTKLSRPKFDYDSSPKIALGLRDENDRVFGPWLAKSSGKDYIAYPDAEIPPGNLTVIEVDLQNPFRTFYSQAEKIKVERRLRTDP